jgi:hypothetical protein
MKLIGIIGVWFMFASPVLAQDKPFDYHSSEELQQKTRERMTKAAASPAGSAGEKIASYGDHAITIAARTKSGGPEMHAQRTDLIMVMDGRATLVLGGKVVGEVAPGGPARRGRSVAATSRVERHRWSRRVTSSTFPPGRHTGSKLPWAMTSATSR